MSARGAASATTSEVHASWSTPAVPRVFERGGSGEQIVPSGVTKRDTVIAARDEVPLGRFLRWCSERVAVNKQVLGGEPVIAGTRLAVRNLAELLAAGESPEAVLAAYPYLTELDLHCVPLFAKVNPDPG